MVTGTRGHIDPLFYSLLSPIDLLFNDSHKIFDNLSPNDPFFLKTFHQNLHFFRNFCQKWSGKICIFTQKIGQICLILTVCSPFVVFSLNDPLFRRKIYHRKPLVSSCCPSTPITSKVECPPPHHICYRLTITSWPSFETVDFTYALCTAWNWRIPGLSFSQKMFLSGVYHRKVLLIFSFQWIVMILKFSFNQLSSP